MTAAHQLGQTVGRAAACRALNVPRASLYRHLRRSQPAAPAAFRPSPPRALAPAEQQRALDVLHSERFEDQAPTEVFATRLDEGKRQSIPSVHAAGVVLNGERERTTGGRAAAPPEPGGS